MVFGATGESDEEKQANELMQNEMETTVYSYGSRPKKSADLEGLVSGNPVSFQVHRVI